MLNILLDIAFPKRCFGCQKVGVYLCTICISRAKPTTSHLCIICDRPAIFGVTHPGCKTKYTPDGLTTAYQFGSPIKELIHEIKYRGVTDSIIVGAALLKKAVPANIAAQRPLIIPVPLHARRMRERGFNQAALLGRALGKHFQLVSNEVAVRRIRETKSQTKLDKFQRKDNVKSAFTCYTKLDGKHILLVDDTATTGATLLECAKVIKRAGAKSVWCVALAQAPLGRKASPIEV